MSAAGASSVDPKVLEMRKLMAERYRQTPASEKPHIRECSECKKPVYASEVCAVTGRYHDLDKKKIIGGTLVDADQKKVTGSDLVKAIDGVRVKWQAARTVKVQVDADSAAIFQTFVLQRQWKLQRFGIMYGTFDSASNAVTVHSVYEPEQRGVGESSFEVLPDAREEKVDRLAALLGLSRVGIMITHPARHSDEMILSGREIMLLAREQSRFGDHCVCVAIAPNPETKEINAQAWQASEQCVHLYRIGLLSEHPSDVRFCHSSQPLELAQDEVDAKGKKQCIIKEPSHSVDCRWMIGYCAVESMTSSIVSSRFMRISRPGEAPPTLTNLQNFLKDPKRKDKKFVEKLSDFHVLVFLTEHLFDIKSDMPLICDAVVRRDNEPVAAFEELINAHIDAAKAGY